MKRFMGSLVLGASLLVSFMYDVSAQDREHRKGFGLLRAIELCDIVVLGTVEAADFVWRQNISHNVTTDITLTVDAVIKGEPNHGTDNVKFMNPGGAGINPNTNEGISMTLSHEPEFKVGEKVLVFLFKAERDPEMPDTLHTPYDGLEVYRGHFGKRLITNGTFNLMYLNTDAGTAMTPVEMPVGLAVKLGEAYEMDKTGAKQLENTIKQRVIANPNEKLILSEDKIKRLKAKAQELIDRAAIKWPPGEPAR